jgi:hypothetical protein
MLTTAWIHIFLLDLFTLSLLTATENVLAAIPIRDTRGHSARVIPPLVTK